MIELRKKNKIHEKKLMKENDLYDAAYDLFINKGFNETAIDDIVKQAGVAKGTFYLYFKDKYDIIDRIILRKSSVVLRDAIDAAMKREFDSFIDRIIFFIDHIIEYFKGNKRLLRLIYKNLSWGLYRKALARPDEYTEMKSIFNNFIEHVRNGEIDAIDIEKTLFMIIELTGSVCYSSIILEEPASIDEMKPFLFNTIRKMLTK